MDKSNNALELSKILLEYYHNGKLFGRSMSNESSSTDKLPSTDELDHQNMRKICIILDECLIATWWLNHKDISYKCAKIIEENIYNCSLGHKQQNIINNLKFHNININIVDGAMYQSTSHNYGDAISQYLFEKLFKVKINIIDAPQNNKNYITMGSICYMSNEQSIIWGSGFIKKEDSMKKARNILCVRGPLTRAKMIIDSIPCPSIYGDPALLLPLVHHYDEIKIKHKYCIIPHYIDKTHSIFNSFKNDIYTDKHSNEFLFADIDTGNNLEYLLKCISKCEIVISSSLHGIIIAAAYKKPCIWIKLSDGTIGGTFKFYDFLYSVGYEGIDKRLDLSHVKSLSDIDHTEILFENHIIDIDRDELFNRGMDLLNSNPFISENDHDNRLNELKDKWNDYIYKNNEK
uniref:Polysaccharide pyruvyl transferase n=1 Tax=Pithovirus LCPAC101 TaxID=2506586 RepID=A0A481Z3C6_9VIRU|nr:MAG: polysaccharide pyruvyl transferase [Pithovirus LCPAC101]